jgi:hypothetical protein
MRKIGINFYRSNKLGTFANLVFKSLCQIIFVKTD